MKPLRLIFFLLFQISCTLLLAQKASEHFGFYNTMKVYAFYGVNNSITDTTYNYDLVFFSNSTHNNDSTLLVSFEKYDTMEYRVLRYNPLDSSFRNIDGASINGKIYSNDSISLNQNIAAKTFNHYYGKKYKPLNIESQHNFSFSVIPNPSTELIFVHNIPKGEELNYSIISYSGKTIINKRLLNKTIDVSFLPNGHYLFAISSSKNKTLYVQKLIKK